MDSESFDVVRPTQNPQHLVETARKLLEYDPATGTLTWRVRRARVFVGQEAGHLARNNGYRRVVLNYKPYLAHRLIWLWVTGEWPKGQIDHIDGDRANNRWVNLRDVSHAINAQNTRRPHSDNLLGLLGVRKTPGGRYEASIWAGRKIYLGVFDTAELAHGAYLDAKRQHHQGCTI